MNHADLMFLLAGIMSVVTSSLLPEKPARRQDEDALQRAVVQFLRVALPDDATFYAVPNGGRRHAKEAARMVGLGLRAGVPDLAIVYRSKAYFVELKRPGGGSLSEHQRQFHRKLLHCGCPVMLCRSVEEVEAQLREACVPLRATTNGSRPMRVGGAAQQGLGV